MASTLNVSAERRAIVTQVGMPTSITITALDGVSPFNDLENLDVVAVVTNIAGTTIVPFDVTVDGNVAALTITPTPLNIPPTGTLRGRWKVTVDGVPWVDGFLTVNKDGSRSGSAADTALTVQVDASITATIDVAGPRGLSAYEIAVADGFVGDEAAWLASLQGEDGAGGVALASTNPVALGAVAVGIGTTAARADHVHPTTGLATSSDLSTGLAGKESTGVAAGLVTAHEADTTNVHGIADTSTLYRSGGTDVAVADGGTGASAAVGARTNLGLVIGTDVEAHDADLTTIAGLAPTNDDLLQRKAGAWTNRTPAQIKTDLALAEADVGLGNVDNTSDANKPVSTATQSALDAKQPLDTDLTAIAALTSAANKVPYATGAGAWALTDLTGVARTLLDDTTIAAMRVTLGLPLDERLVRKPADETVNNSTTLQNDDHLTFSIAANEVWVGTFTVFVVGDATADWKAELTVPSGATIVRSAIGQRTADTVVLATGSVPLVLGAAAEIRHADIAFSVTNGATPGSVTLQWAQSVLTVADTTVKAGSYLTAKRVA